MNPTVSVLLPVFNGAAYIRESVESILAQTFQDFELIIIDDGSQDDSAQIIERIKDSRIRLYRQANQGLPATLNGAIGLANGEFLARQDQDDVSFPRRFETQVSYLRSHAGCGLVGTWAEIIAGTEKTGRVHRHAEANHALQFDLLFDNPFVHSSVMLRKSAVQAVGMYSVDPARQPPEDYELWSRLSRKCEVANIPEILHVYREIPTSMSRNGVGPFRHRVIDISVENIRWWMEGVAGASVIEDLAALNHSVYSRVSPRVRWTALSRLMIGAADRIAATCQVPRSILRARAQAQLCKIKPHYYRCTKRHGLLPMIEELSAKFERLVSGWD
jgi:hypothetical protein